VYDKLGRPKLPAEYGLKPMEGTTASSSRRPRPGCTRPAEWAQARTINERWNAHMSEQIKSTETAAQAAHTAQIEQLKKDWGADFESTKRSSTAHRQIRHECGSADALKQAMGPADADEVHAQHRQSWASKAASSKARQRRWLQRHDSRSRRRRRSAELRKDPAFTARFLAGDVEARKEMERLHKLAYPGDSTFRSDGIDKITMDFNMTPDELRLEL
jgi:hypothetical protein